MKSVTTVFMSWGFKMNSIRNNLRRAKECDSWSREAYQWEACALSTIKGMVSIWADDTHRGEKLKGHHLVRWKKQVDDRIQELDRIFKEAEK